MLGIQNDILKEWAVIPGLQFARGSLKNPLQHRSARRRQRAHHPDIPAPRLDAMSRSSRLSLGPLKAYTGQKSVTGTRNLPMNAI